MLTTPSQKWQSMEYHLLGYFAKFILLVSQVPFAKLSNPHCSFFNLVILSSWLYYFVKSTLPNHKVHITKINIAKLPRILQHVNSFNELLVAYEYKILWIVQCLNSFQSAKIYAPKTQKIFKIFPRLPLPQWIFFHEFSQLGDQKNWKKLEIFVFWCKFDQKTT
jgi:hypothetical protein